MEATLKVAFDTPAYFDFYYQIAQKYKEYDFRDHLTDSERLTEYAKVYQQFRKFVGSKQSAVIDRQENLLSLEAWLKDQLERSDVYPSNRVDMVYNSLKVDWLRNLINVVGQLVEQMNGGY